MTADEFRKSAEQPSGTPPAGLSGALQALWHEANGDWGRAHECSQGARNREGDWVHAYLHRKEGDAGNAAYWYSRAARPVAQGSSDAEWTAIAAELLGSGAKCRLSLRQEETGVHSQDHETKRNGGLERKPEEWEGLALERQRRPQ